jgi:type I restriction enzyme S subunit
MSDLPHGWEWTSVGEICHKPQYGWTTRSAADAGGLPYLRTTDITKGPIDWQRVPRCEEDPPDPAAFMLEDGDLVVSRAGSVGVSARVQEPPPAVFASYLIRLRVIPPMSSAYLQYFLKSPAYWRQVSDAKVGIAVQNVNATKLAAITVPLPPLEEQGRIVAAIEEHLSRLDAAVADTTHASARVRQLRLDMIESRMAGLGNPIALEALVQSGGITDGPFGSKLKSSHYTDHGPRVIRLENVGVGEFIDERTHISTGYFDELRKHEAYGGDLVVASLVSDRLRACVVPQDLGPAIVKADCIRVRLRPDMDPRFFNYALMRPSLGAFVAENIRGVGRSRLGLGNVRKLPVPEVPPEGQRQVADELDHQLDLCSRVDSQCSDAIGRSTLLRRSILAAAFSGRLVPQDPKRLEGNNVVEVVGRLVLRCGPG